MCRSELHLINPGVTDCYIPGSGIVPPIVILVGTGVEGDTVPRTNVLFGFKQRNGGRVYGYRVSFCGSACSMRSGNGIIC